MSRVEVNLQDIFWALKKYIVWVVLACIVGAVGTYAYTELFVTPVYSTKVSLVAFASIRDSENVSNNELAADMNITYTHTALMNSEPVCEAVSKELGGRLPVNAISGMITASRVPSTQVINVEVKSTDPELVIEVGNALLKVAPKVLQEKTGGQVSPVNSAKQATLVSPNVVRNVVYGLLASFILACAFVVLVAVLDTTIWREEDLERSFSFPVLGNVPSMTIAMNLSNKHKKKKKGR